MCKARKENNTLELKKCKGFRLAAASVTISASWEVRLEIQGEASSWKIS